MSGNSFLSKVLWLFTGLLLAQLINTGFAFILPRIYDPEDFAHFGIFLATVLIFFEVNNFKLDYALMLPPDDKESIFLYKKAVLYSTIFSGVLMGIFVSYKLIPLKAHADYLGWIPVSVFINGIYQPTVTWCNRHQLYKHINISRILQAVVTGLISCAPVFILTPRTLLIQGFVMGQLAALLVVMGLIIPLLEERVEADDKMILKYIQFPKFGTWSSLVNTISRNMVVYVIEIFFSPVQIGYYTFTSRLVHAPLGIVTGAVSQAFFRDASMMKDNHQLADLTKKVSLSLTALSALPLILSLGWGPELFAFLFGEEWYAAGEVARWLSLWYATSLIVTPLTMLLDIKRLLRWELYFNIAFLIARLGVLLIGGWTGNFKVMLLLFCGTGVFFHILILWKIKKILSV